MTNFKINDLGADYKEYRGFVVKKDKDTRGTSNSCATYGYRVAKGFLETGFDKRLGRVNFRTLKDFKVAVDKFLGK